MKLNDHLNYTAQVLGHKQTLLERWDDSHTETMRWKPDEIRRAIAIAQAVDEFRECDNIESAVVADCICVLADELLKRRR
jgi:hypothetical protein